MALGTFVAGRYTATYNAVDVGMTRQGYELQQTLKQEAVDETDAYGLSTIDYIYRGGDCFVQYECREYKAGSYGPFWPFGGGTLGVLSTSGAPVGILASSVAQSFVLTSTANTPAAAAPASLTAAGAILAPNFDGRLLYDSRLRAVPVRLQCLPTIVSTVPKWFVQT